MLELPHFLLSIARYRLTRSPPALRGHWGTFPLSLSLISYTHLLTSSSRRCEIAKIRRSKKLALSFRQ
eukprot:scaffold36376_cov27-Tisochrysis_lutea.AAC.1